MTANKSKSSRSLASYVLLTALALTVVAASQRLNPTKTFGSSQNGGQESLSEYRHDAAHTSVTPARRLEDDPPEQDEIPILESAQVACEPAVVGAQSADLSIRFMSPVKVWAGGSLRVQIPESASVLEGQSISCKLRGFVDASTLCQTEGPQTIIFPLESDLEQFVTTEFIFPNIFWAPMTSAETDPFQVSLVAADGSVVAENEEDFVLFGLDPAALQEATITQVDSVRVSSETTVYFSVTTLNPIPAGGGVQVILPKWNDGAPFSLGVPYIVEDDSGPTCTPKLGVADSINCSIIYSSPYDYITIKDAFPEGREAGNTFSFYVSKLLNPISMSPYPIQLLTYSEVLFEDDEAVTFTGKIDKGVAMFTAQEEAAIDPADCIVNATDSTVQQFSDFYIPFKVPVPIAEGCIVLIEIPADFTVKAGDLSRVEGWGIFGGRTDLIAEIDEASRTVKIVDQCVAYSGANIQSTVKLTMIQNPLVVRETASFAIYVKDSNTKGIASISSGVTYTPTAGTVGDISLISRGGMEIQEVTNLQLSFTPSHMMQGESSIILKLPDIVSFSCTLASTKGMKVAPTCTELAENVIKFQNPFIDDYYPGDKPLAFIFQYRVLPRSNEMIKGITIETYMTIDAIEYIVDSFDDREYEFFAPVQVLFLSSSVLTESKMTYTETKFTLTHSLASSVPAGAIIHVEIPPQILVLDEEAVEESCDSTENLETSTMKCQLEELDDGWHKLTVTDAFGLEGLDRYQEFILEIHRGLLTPISVKSSDTFKVRITDANLYEINYVEEALPVTMKRGQDVGPIQLEVASPTVGDRTSQNVTFQAPVPLYDGYIIYVLIPEECEPPMETEFVCKGQAPFAEDFLCTINGHRISIVVNSSTSEGAVTGRRLLEEEGAIAQGESISFEFSPITNPHSLKPSQPYSISIATGEYYEVARQVTVGPPVVNTAPGVVVDYEFEALDSRQQALTTITLSWVNTQLYPADLSLVINYDPTQIVPMNTEQGPPDCFYSRTVFVECQFEDHSLTVRNILQSEVYPGQQMSLTITNMLINVTEPLVTNSWSLKSFTEEGRYAIDEIKGDLSLEFSCSFPCLTCAEGSPDVCTSCNLVDGYAILYEGVCYEECPTGTYYESFACKPCNSKCLTCTYLSPTWCTSCDPESDHPFLDGNTCTDTCGFGEYGSYETAQCEECGYNCLSCEFGPDTCRSCSLDSVNKHYFEDTCVSECPSGFVADTAQNDFVCIPCNPNCLVCSGSPDVCATCPAGSALNLLDYKCTEQCPPDITVRSLEEASGQETCEPCDSNCETCAGSPSFCTSCQDNMSLQEDTGKCLLNCDTENFLEVAINGECEKCTDSCKTCQGTTDNCLSCQAGYLFHGSKCLRECPELNGFQYEDNGEGRCVIPGLICKFGYSLVPSGDGCALDLSVCEAPDTLNYDKTKCVPGADDWVPFPILAACLCLTLLVALCKVTRRETRFIANMIVFWSVMETVCMVALIWTAVGFGITPVVYLTLAALLLHYMINFFFAIIFWNQVRQDKTFRHWCTYHTCGITTITVLSCIFNFKIYRLVYSKLLGRDDFNAPFDDPYMFFRPFNLISFINLFTVKVLTLIAACFTTVYVSWGYQLFIVACEMIVIQLVLLLCYIAEYCQMRVTLMKKPKYFTVERKEVDRLRVMGGLEDDLSDDHDPDENLIAIGQESHHFKHERPQPKNRLVYNVNTMEKLLTSLQKREYAKEHGMDTFKEIDQLHEQEIMMRNRRRCRSFRIERPTVEEHWGEDSDDGVGQNFISEPSSPRSKEMLHNGFFVSRMAQLQRVYKMRDMYDNCYAEAVNVNRFISRDMQTRSVKVQTNLLELLGIDDLAGESQSQVDVGSEHYVEAQGIEQLATAQLIDGVIDKLESHESVEEKQSDPNALNYSEITPAEQPAEAPTESQQPKKKKRKRLTRRRMAEIPNINIDEVTGEYDEDKNGTHIILKTKDGKLNDKYGRLVNRRGYLIDTVGNVVTRGGIFIFYADEVDFDDEIPAPYCFQKSQQAQYKIEAFEVFRKKKKQDKLAMQEEFIEREYQRLKAASRQHKEIHSQKLQSAMGLKPPSEATWGDVLSANQMDLLGKHSSDEELVAEKFVDQNTVEQRKGRSKKASSKRSSLKPGSSGRASGKSGQPEDDVFIQEVIQPMKPKSKNELMGLVGAEAAHAGDMSITEQAAKLRTEQSPKQSRRSSKKQSVDKQSRKGGSQRRSAEQSRKSGPRQKSAEQSNRSEPRQKSIEQSKRSGSQRRSIEAPVRRSHQSRRSRSKSRKSHESANINGSQVNGPSLHDGRAESEYLMQSRQQSESHLGDDRELQLKDLVFEGAERSVNASKASRHAKQLDAKRRSAKEGHDMMVAVPGENSMQVYERELDKLRNQQRAVKNDDEFIRKMDKFNRFISQKQQQYARNQGLMRPHSSTHPHAVDQFSDGPVRLQQKNLNQIYGRVRQKFNKQMRMGATLKFKQESDARRDEMTMEELQQKLNETALPNFDARKPGSKSSKRAAHGMDKEVDRFNQLAEIYSNYKTELPYSTTHHRHQGPKSQHNQFVPDASSFRRAEQVGTKSGGVANGDLSSHDQVSRKVRNVNRQFDLASSSASAERSRMRQTLGSKERDKGQPSDILHGKFL